ncbi:MAG: preprotein translocase subunit YajC [Phycisphaerae bacterium]|nr:preprotein translocase subunit YajC [Phycisphaerae bacterium]|tara:strand:- start:459 stop:902 length:444 start_codon:yes stop_codon:yes gene_type:complete
MTQATNTGDATLLVIGSVPVQPPLGGAQSGGGVIGEPGTPAEGAEGAQAPPSLFGPGLMPFIFVILFLFIGMSFLSQRREKKRRKALLDQLAKKASVQTIGGIMGSVIEVKGDLVVLEVDKSSNTRMTFSRSAIQQVLEPGEGAAAN